jgi:hypothetical protein
VDAFDVLLAIVQQVYEETQRLGVNLAPGRFQSFWQDLWDILRSTVEPTSVNVGLGDIIKLGIEVKRNPNHRLLVRQHLQPRTATFLEAVNEVLDEAEQRLQSKQYEGLVVIMDSLDRVIRNPIPGTTRTSHEALFVDSATLLSSLNCHLIYTVPPALIHSPAGGGLARLFGMPHWMLPMVPVTTSAGEPNEAGLTKLHEAVEKRLQRAETSCEDAFDTPETVRRLCAASGGYVRSLMSLTRGAITYVDDMPITGQAVEQAIQQSRNAFMGAIYPPHWEVLRQVAVTREITAEENCLQLLENLIVLEYLDSHGPWYDINPVLREALAARPAAVTPMT